MIGSDKYTTVPEPKINTVSFKSIICFISIVFFMIFVFLINNHNNKDYNKLIETTENDESYNKIFDLLKESNVEGNILKELNILKGSSDQEGLLGLDNQYAARAKVSARIGNYINSDEAITIEVFNNQEDLKLRKAYLQAQNEYLKEVYIDYGVLPGMGDLPYHRVIYSKGNALMTIDGAISIDEKLKYRKLFYQTMNKVNYKEKSIPDDKKIKKIKAENDKRLLAWKQKYSQDKLLDSLNELKNKMSKRVDAAYASGNIALVNYILDELKFYNIEKYKDEYQTWNNALNRAKDSLNEGTLLPDMIDKQNQYKQTIYGDGKYLSGVDILPGEYVLVKNNEGKKAEVSIGYSNMEVYGNTIINVDCNESGYIYYGEIALNGVSMYHIDNSPQLTLKSPGTFKVGKHIQAGEYEISAGSVTKYFLLDTYNGLFDEVKLKKAAYEIGTEPQIITVRDGQYLVLNDSSIQIKKK